jgi:C4-dicarboxylate-specific signal transduction histidine kinase
MLDKLETLVIHSKENGGIKFSFQCSDPAMTLLADEQMLTQVMLNLVKNAVQALEATVDPLIEISASRSETEIRLTVSDNGPGIPQEIADEIFLPFFTTREKGTGVGLSYSRQVMMLNGGTISFNSNVGNTSFVLSFSN